MNKMQTLAAFWSGFGIAAYDENTVPSGENAPDFPYITYELGSDNLGYEMPLTASLWYRGYSWQDISEKEMQIADYITRGGRMLACDDGGMWIKKGSPWAQRMDEASDDTIRRIVLNVNVEFID